MTRSRPIIFLASAAVIPLSALAVAACGGGGAAATAAPATPAAPAPAHAKTGSTHTATVRVAHSSLGRILVNSHGRTLYLFKADVGRKSACFGACAIAWPPLLATGKATAGTGLAASKLGTIKRSGGKRQVTYNGHPLYLFIMDHKPGDVKGEGLTAFGAAWFALSPAGNQIPTRHAASSSSRPAAPPAPSAAKPQPAPTPTAKPAPKPAPPPVAKPAPPASGIPQNGGGDGDSDNNGGPSDGDGNV